jgi:hypothetical protein
VLHDTFRADFKTNLYPLSLHVFFCLQIAAVINGGLSRALTFVDETSAIQCPTDIPKNDLLSDRLPSLVIDAE